MQKVIIDGIERYNENPLISYMVRGNINGNKVDLNDIWIYAQKNSIKRKYMRQLYKLIGYSTSGYKDIDFTRLDK